MTYIITPGSSDGLNELKFLIIPSLPVAVVTLFIIKTALTFMSNKKNALHGTEAEQPRVQSSDNANTVIQNENAAEV